MLFLQVVTIAVVLAYAWMRSRRRASRKQEGAQGGAPVPKRWPMSARPLANKIESDIWLWLQQEVFPQYRVLPKLPVTRFTLPNNMETGKQWFQQLDGIYCTFSLCTEESRVIGCVDVQGPNGPSEANRHIKQTLLEQCGITYVLVQYDALPSAQALRQQVHQLSSPDSTFGEAEAERLRFVRKNLQKALDKNRALRQSLRPGATAQPPAWDNSFLGTLDDVDELESSEPSAKEASALARHG